MTVQQDYRLPVTTMPHAQDYLSDVDVVEREAFEHEAFLPGATKLHRLRRSSTPPTSYSPMARRAVRFSLGLTGQASVRRRMSGERLFGLARSEGRF